MALNQIVPLLNVSDMQRSVAFHGDGLGFRMVNAWPPAGELRWCMLERDQTRIMIQLASTKDASPNGHGVCLCVFCDDAVALYREFVRRGVDAGEPFVGNAVWVTSVADPDGYRIDFESPTDRAEETRLSDIEQL